VPTKTYQLRSVKSIDQDIKQLPHNPGIYIVRIGGNGFGNGAVVYVGKAEASIRARWRERVSNFYDNKDNSDHRMFADIAAHLARGSRVTIECRTVTLKQFWGDRGWMKRRIRHDEGVLIRHYRKPRLNKIYEDAAIDPLLSFVDGVWQAINQLLVLVGCGVGLALLFKMLMG
jgi:hypothetical protein